MTFTVAEDQTEGTTVVVITIPQIDVLFTKFKVSDIKAFETADTIPELLRALAVLAERIEESLEEEAESAGD